MVNRSVPMLTKQEALASRLSDFNETEGVRGSAIVTRDGLPLISALPRGVNQETFAAMVATTVGAAETAAAELDPSPAKRVRVDFGRLSLITGDAGPELVVVAILEGEKTDVSEALEKLAGEVKDII